MYYEKEKNLTFRLQKYPFPKRGDLDVSIKDSYTIQSLVYQMVVVALSCKFEKNASF